MGSGSGSADRVGGGGYGALELPLPNSLALGFGEEHRSPRTSGSGAQEPFPPFWGPEAVGSGRAES